MAVQLAKRVKAGAAFLDVVRPGWRKKINEEILALDSGDACVLGQIDGEYSLYNLGLSEEVAASLGFQAGDDDHLDDSGEYEQDKFYSKLTKAWKRFLRK